MACSVAAQKIREAGPPRWAALPLTFKCDSHSLRSEHLFIFVALGAGAIAVAGNPTLPVPGFAGMDRGFTALIALFGLHAVAEGRGLAGVSTMLALRVVVLILVVIVVAFGHGTPPRSRPRDPAVLARSWCNPCADTRNGAADRKSVV